MGKTIAKKSDHVNALKSLISNQIFIPIAALLLLVVFNLIMDPSFFAIKLGTNSTGNAVLSGYLITILDSGSELAILAIGMTLVTAASGGQDISVGATIAITGSVILRVLCGTNSRPDSLQAPIIVAFLVACVAGMLCGAFNGILVAKFKIQPMVATLILFTAGRSIAAWINNNELPVISDKTFTYFGGYIPGIPIPTPFFIAMACVLVIALVLKFTNLRLYIQSVGINEGASKLNGLNPAFVKFLSFVILGLCVAVAGLIKVSRISTINYSVIAKDIEMDAILAVALGGNALGGGKFNMTASILGAYVIQCLTTTLYKFNVQSDALPAYKAVVVIALVVFSAPMVKEKVAELGKKMKKIKKQRRLHNMKNKNKRSLTKSNLLLIITIAVFFLMYIGAIIIEGQGFLKPQTFLNILNANAALIITSCGMSIVMITAGIDISVGGVAALVSMCCAVYLDFHDGSVFMSIIIAVLIGLAFGVVQGFLVAYLGIQPFIVSLAGMFFARGMTTIVNTKPFNVANEAFVGLKSTRVVVPGLGTLNKLGKYVDAYVEIGVIVAILIVIVFFCLLRWSKLGRHFYAVGGNEQSALMLGINVKRTKFLAHLLCGLLAGIGGYVYFLHVGSGSASHASGMEMNAIASSIIGGTLLTGGVGNIIGTLFGVLSLSTIQNIVSSAGFDQAWWTGITVAGMLCIFLVIQSVIMNRKKK